MADLGPMLIRMCYLYSCDPVSIDGQIREIDRVDGRSADQLRPLACSRNVLNCAHGSASWSQGETKVFHMLRSMDQKLELTRMRIQIRLALKSFGSQKLGRLVVHDDGALLPCAINAGCAALIDAASLQVR